MSFNNALKWSFLSELAVKAVQPIVFVALARLLAPEDFGVMSAALMVIGLSQIFCEAGMGKALIQRQAQIEDAANATFWINVCLGLVIAAFLLLVAESVAHNLFHDGRVAAVLQIMSLQVVLSALSTVPTALLQKQMSFKSLFWVRIATVSLPSMASIPMAWNGMGYWALVIGSLVGNAVQVAMLWNISHWRPRWSLNPTVVKEMVRFGAWAGTSGLLGWFYVWADSLIVGMHLGSHDLGIYRTGNIFASMIFVMLLGPIIPVLYSHLSRMGQNIEKMREVTKIIIHTLTFTTIPIAMITYSLSEPISNIIFGETWNGISLAIGVLTLMHGYAWIVGMNGEIYRSIGKPSYETIVNASTLFIYLAGYLYSIRFGLEAFLSTRLALALGATMLQLLVMRNILSLPIRPILNYILTITVICGISVFLVNHYLTTNIDDPWGRLIIGGFVSFSTVASALYFLERDNLIKRFRQIYQRL